MLAWFSEIFNALAAAIVSVLPTSPFSDAIASLSDLPYLGWLNWFIPVGTCIKIAGAGSDRAFLCLLDRHALGQNDR